MKQKLPKVSFVIPTYNAAKNISECLKQIKVQNYPKNLIEILIIDGMSSDSTVKIAKEYTSNIILNHKRDAESGKYIGILHSTGEIIIMLDSDNYLNRRDWLLKMTHPLLSDKEIFGVESFYFSRNQWGVFNEYLMLLHIGDPLAYAMSSKIHPINKGRYLEYIIPKGGTFPLGANGFLWRREVINKVGLTESKFEEANFAYKTYLNGYTKFARVSGVGVYHDHIRGLGDFIKKRIKIGKKFLTRIKEDKETWVGSSNKLSFILSVIYCASIIGPLVEGVYKYIRFKKRSWLLHPIFSFITIIIYIYVFILHIFKKWI